MECISQVKPSSREPSNKGKSWSLAESEITFESLLWSIAINNLAKVCKTQNQTC